jgi:GTP cyclohydrolase I
VSIHSSDPTSLSSGDQALPDVQGLADHRRVAIDKVGVSQVRYPIQLRTPAGGRMPASAVIDMFVSLPADRKGTHMSRFMEVLGDHAHGLDPLNVRDMCAVLRERLDADDAYVRMAFTYFINKFAPVTQKPGLLDYEVEIDASSHASRDDVVLTVAASATSLCPCSKEISAFGAHNQRCRIAASVRFDGELLIEDLAEILESAASCEVYSVLKRPDEKFVTEEAYKNPKFVEDIIRDLATALDRDERITWFRITSENFESIHGHNAYAEIVRDKRADSTD